MPLTISPRPKEPRQAFLSRCMGSEVMKREFPDNKQRVAVCFSILRKAGRKVPKPK